jgi:DNA-binding transcriptional LysR family regulator
MDIERFRYFKLLAERGHLRETAELVALSPGALSRAIKALERELGVALFRVAGKRLVLSDRGRALLPRVDRLLDEYSAVRESATERTPPSAPIRFCSYSIFTTYFLGHLLREMAPAEEVFSRNVGPGGIEASIASFESDFGLTYLPVPTPGIEFVPVTKIAMGVFIRRSAFPGLSLEEIPCSMPMTRISAATASASRIDAWPDSLPRGRVRFHIEQLETALECCRQGLSWGYFPQFLVWLHNQHVRPEAQLEQLPHKSSALQTFLVKRLGDDESPAMKRTSAALRDVAKRARAAL